MVDSLIVLQNREPVEVPLSRCVHPKDVKVVVLWVSVQTIRHVGCASTIGYVQHKLPIHWSEHVSSREEEVVFVFGHLSDDRIPAHRDVDDELPLSGTHAFDRLLFLLLIVLHLLVYPSSR